jgi:hypothetical protein
MSVQSLKNQNLQVSELIVSNEYQSNASGYVASAVTLSSSGVDTPSIIIENSSTGAGQVRLVSSAADSLSVVTPSNSGFANVKADSFSFSNGAVLASGSGTNINSSGTISTPAVQFVQGSTVCPQILPTNETTLAVVNASNSSQENLLALSYTLPNGGALSGASTSIITSNFNISAPSYYGGMGGAVFTNGGTGYLVNLASQFNFNVELPSTFTASANSLLFVQPISTKAQSGDASYYNSIQITAYVYVSGNTFTIYGFNNMNQSSYFYLSVIAYNP